MMRAVIFCFLCASCTTAESPDTAAAPIMAQEEAWAEALLAADMEAIDALMHPNFRLIRSYGEAAPIDKATYLGMPGMSASAIEITSAEVEISNRVAVAQLSMTLDWQQEGVGKLPPHFDLTDVWLQADDGTWRILSRVSQLTDRPAIENE